MTTTPDEKTERLVRFMDEKGEEVAHEDLKPGQRITVSLFGTQKQAVVYLVSKKPKA